MTNTLGQDLLWATSASLFAREALGFVADKWQNDALAYQGRRGIWNISRQAGKSVTAAVLGLHCAIYKPNALVLLASPSLRQSVELYRKVQEFMAMMDYPPDLVESTKSACEFALTGSRIVCLPATEATIRGYSGVDLIIEDEASRVSDAFHVAIRPMLAVSGGRHFQLSTPWGKRGHFYHTWIQERPGWQRIKITADQCSRITQEFVDNERIETSAWSVAQEYYCEFNEMVDALFTTSVIEAAFTDEVEELFPELDFQSFIQGETR